MVLLVGVKWLFYSEDLYLDAQLDEQNERLCHCSHDSLLGLVYILLQFLQRF